MVIKISAVSYLNTLPFVYGLRHSDFLNEGIALSLDVPSVCAAKVESGEADVGLIPVAVVPRIAGAQIVSDFCIGADSDVNTVLLLSQCPLDEMDTVYLDYQSRTSVELVQVLAREFWKIEPRWVSSTPGYEQMIEGRTGGVVIGDRTFELPPFAYRYDLAGEWKKMTGLPFVFAAWVANKELPAEFIAGLNRALQFGVAHTQDAIAEYLVSHPYCPANLERYLTHDIQYGLDAAKRKAMLLFWEKMQENVKNPKFSTR